MQNQISKFFICVILLCLVACKDSKKPSSDSGNDNFNFPKPVALTPEQQSTATNLLMNLRELQTGAEETQESRSQISDVIQDSCEMSKTEQSTNSSLQTLRELVNAPNKICPLSFQDSSYINFEPVSNNLTNFKVVTNSELNVKDEPLISLSTAKLVKYSGTGFGTVKVDGDSFTFNISLDMNGTITDTELGTLELIVKSRVVDTKANDDEFIQKVGYALQAPFGWIVLIIDNTNGTYVCNLNGFDISQHELCQKRGPTGSYLMKAALNHFKR